MTTNKITTKVSRGLRVLPPKNDTLSPSKELAGLQNEAKEIEKWWNSERWQYTKRPYKGMSVCLSVCVSLFVSFFKKRNVVMYPLKTNSFYSRL